MAKVGATTVDLGGKQDDIRVKTGGSTIIKVSGSGSNLSQSGSNKEKTLESKKSSSSLTSKKSSSSSGSSIKKKSIVSTTAIISPEPPEVETPRNNASTTPTRNLSSSEIESNKIDDAKVYPVTPPPRPIPDSPPITKTTHFPAKSSPKMLDEIPEHGDEHKNGGVVRKVPVPPPMPVASNGHLNSSFESEGSSGYGKKSPDPIITPSDRHRKVDDDEMGGGARCCFGFLITLAQILLHGALGLVLYWVFMFHRKEGQTWPFSWKTDPAAEFWLHPVLMIAGFIYFMGQAMLVYRTCRCCRRIWSKLLHTMFHLLAIACIVVAFIAVWDSHQLKKDENGLPKPIPDFYSLHSWMGLATMGLFALQFVVGFFSFLLLLCCESATASFRAKLVPIHSTFGITTFVLAVATACSGLTEKAFFTLSVFYSQWVNYVDRDWERAREETAITKGGVTKYFTERLFHESLVINSLGATLIALLFVMPILLLHPRFRSRPQQVIAVTSSNNHHHDRYA